MPLAASSPMPVMIMDWNYGTLAGETSRSSASGDGSQKISLRGGLSLLIETCELLCSRNQSCDFCVAILPTRQHIATTPKNGANYESQTFTFAENSSQLQRQQRFSRERPHAQAEAPVNQRAV